MMKVRLSSKKGMEIGVITEIALLVIIFAILLFVILSTLNGDSRYASSIPECALLFSKATGSSAFFGPSLDKVQPSFITTVSEFCPSKTVTVSARNVDPASELIKDCWQKVGNGEFDPMGKLMRGESLCIYCGSIKVSGGFSEIQSLLTKELQAKKYASLFTNNGGVVSVNSEVTNVRNPASKSMGVFYFAYRYQIDPKSVDSNWDATKEAAVIYILDPAKKTVFSQLSGPAKYLATQAINPSGQTYAGIQLIDLGSSTSFDTTQVKNIIAGEQVCSTVIVPDKDYH
jgi:hypothetical protein